MYCAVLLHNNGYRNVVVWELNKQGTERLQLIKMYEQWNNARATLAHLTKGQTNGPNFSLLLMCL